MFDLDLVVRRKVHTSFFMVNASDWIVGLEGARVLRPCLRYRSQHFAGCPNTPIKWPTIGPNDERGLRMF